MKNSSYKEEFLEFESNLRPKSCFTHKQAISMLSVIVEKADDEINKLSKALTISIIFNSLALIAFIISKL